MTAEQESRAQGLYRLGMSDERIARQIGASKSSVANWRRGNEFPPALRPGRDYRSKSGPTEFVRQPGKICGTCRYWKDELRDAVAPKVCDECGSREYWEAI